VRRRRARFIIIVQSILFAAHAFVYETWTAFSQAADPPGISRLAVIFALLSVSFVAASLLAFRYYNLLARLFYSLAAGWLGILNYCFLAAIACWVIYAGARVAGVNWERREIAIVLFGLGAAAGAYGIVNASWTRVKRITVKLANLPESWRGRVAALVSDTHFGPVRGYRFSRRIVAILDREQPDIVFLAGDVYDGTAADVNLLAKPFAGVTARLGTYFVTGNHEEFGDDKLYLEGLRRAGVRVLENERVSVDGLQIVGVSYRTLATPDRFLSAMRKADLDKNRASVLLAHAPNRLWEAEQAGISLQLSGHTHAGQFFPWTRIVSRIYGKFAYGLQQLGNMTVYTSCGAGTWGPPLRLGTNPEIVLIQFE
jgi:predicted MPP superfamily phosphohydrolase